MTVVLFVVAVWVVVALLLTINWALRLRRYEPNARKGTRGAVVDSLVTYVSALLWPAFLVWDGLGGIWRSVR